MARKSRLQISKADIIKTFSSVNPVLKQQEISEIFHENKEFWRLAQSTSLTSFIQFMLEQTNLTEVKFDFPNRIISGYTWGSAPLMEVLLHLVDNSYYSHYTAIRVHGLTEQVPKTTYLSREKSHPNSGGAPLQTYEQSAIDSAFEKSPRISKNEISIEDENIRLLMLESAHHSNLGIIDGEINFGGGRPLKIRYTNLERTMIDIVVRPFYAGGVFEVAKAFENAKGHLSVNTMASMLKKMAFGYPYHQAIGFYLEKAGYKQSVVDIFMKIPMTRDFYLSHNMGNSVYNEKWRIFTPVNF